MSQLNVSPLGMNQLELGQLSMSQLEMSQLSMSQLGMNQLEISQRSHLVTQLWLECAFVRLHACQYMLY